MTFFKCEILKLSNRVMYKMLQLWKYTGSIIPARFIASIINYTRSNLFVAKRYFFNEKTDDSNESFLPARKSFAGMTERLSSGECHNTTNTNVPDGHRSQHGGEKEIERDTRTLRQPASLWAANMIVTWFYRARREDTWLLSAWCNNATARPPSSLAIRSYILKSGGDVNFWIRGSRGEYRRYCISRVFVSIGEDGSLSKLSLSHSVPRRILLSGFSLMYIRSRLRNLLRRKQC